MIQFRRPLLHSSDPCYHLCGDETGTASSRAAISCGTLDDTDETGTKTNFINGNKNLLYPPKSPPFYPHERTVTPRYLPLSITDSVTLHREGLLNFPYPCAHGFRDALPVHHPDTAAGDSALLAREEKGLFGVELVQHLPVRFCHRMEGTQTHKKALHKDIITHSPQNASPLAWSSCHPWHLRARLCHMWRHTSTQQSLHHGIRTHVYLNTSLSPLAIARTELWNLSKLQC